jgi:hypothetical protein
MAEFGPTTFGNSSCNLHNSQMRQHDQLEQYKYLHEQLPPESFCRCCKAATAFVKVFLRRQIPMSRIPLSMVATAFPSWGLEKARSGAWTGRGRPVPTLPRRRSKCNHFTTHLDIPRRTYRMIPSNMISRKIRKKERHRTVVYNVLCVKSKIKKYTKTKRRKNYRREGLRSVLRTWLFTNQNAPRPTNVDR